MRLLVIEDDPKIASFIRRGLTQEHYAVDHAHDGEEGAAMAEDPAYDLVILDMMLPKLSGMQVLRAIRHKRKKLPVLFLTAKVPTVLNEHTTPERIRTRLLAAQRGHGVDGECAARGNQAGECSHRE